jgi:hypothetical protein
MSHTDLFDESMEAIEAKEAIQPRRRLQFDYDEESDVITIEGRRYSGELFRSLSGELLAPGDVFQLLESDGSTVKCKTVWRDRIEGNEEDRVGLRIELDAFTWGRLKRGLLSQGLGELLEGVKMRLAEFIENKWPVEEEEPDNSRARARKECTLQREG